MKRPARPEAWRTEVTAAGRRTAADTGSAVGEVAGGGLAQTNACRAQALVKA